MIMSGTREGGVKARETMYKRHGKDFYKRIGAKGGRNGNTGGFACFEVGKDGLTGYERAKVYGRIGGLKSKRGLAKRESYKKVIANIKRFEYE